MNDIVILLAQIKQSMQAHMPFLLSIVGIVAAINLLNWLSGSLLNYLGIFPRHLFGLIGIITAPILHANFNHLFFNAIPWLVLAQLILMLRTVHDFLYINIIIIVVSGFLTWLLARKAIHIGASALIMGYLSFLLGSTYLQPSMLGLVIGFVCLYYFGGLLFDLLPSAVTVSWEGHIFGFIGGLVALFIT
jgi:membrane associated rhomboid family serine protease